MSDEEYLKIIEEFRNQNREDYESGKVRKVFTECLPKWENGVNRGCIDWYKCIGKKVYFIYENIENWIKIIDYDRKTGKLFTLYESFEYSIFAFSFAKAEIGKCIDKLYNFKYNVNDIVNTRTGKIKIIEKYYGVLGSEKHKKKYKYECLICEYKGEIGEKSLGRGNGCSCCCNRTSVLGINTIWDTDRWMCDLGVSEEDAKNHTRCSDEKIQVTCPNCGMMKPKRIADIYNTHTIGCVCSDSISYGEKFIFNMLKQIKVRLTTQLSKTTFNWCNKYRYDFYLNNYNIIIEAHGLQHYEDGFSTIKGAKTLIEQIDIDKCKENLALINGIKKDNYIIIDCKYSNMEYVKNSILNNEKINKHFDLSKVDFNLCHKYALSNLVKIACEYKKNNHNMTTTEISEIMGYHPTTILKWLKSGNLVNWCKYDSKDEKSKRSVRNGKLSGKEVEIFKDNISLGVFESCTELERKSEELFNVKLDHRATATVCRGKRKKHKGYTFKYV